MQGPHLSVISESVSPLCPRSPRNLGGQQTGEAWETAVLRVGLGAARRLRTTGGRCPDVGQQRRRRKAGGWAASVTAPAEVVRVDVGVLGPPEVLTLPREEIRPGGLDGTQRGPSSEWGLPNELRVKGSREAPGLAKPAAK